MPEESEKPYRGVIQTLLSLAKNHKRQFAIAAGLLQPPVYRRAITGSIIGNVLLVGGLSMLMGGVRYKTQSFNRMAAQNQATMLLLAANGWFTQLARQSGQPAEQVDGVTGV